MNTIENLNTALTITYNTESSYAIVFGANSGNTSSNVDPFGNTALAKQCSITSVTSAVRDILVDVTCDEVGAINLAYNNACTAISVSQISSAGWRINGIRTVAQYDEAFANTRFTDLLGTVEDSTEYRLTTVVNDQKGNTQTWSTAVEVLDLPSLSMTGAVIYDEDVQANVTQVAIPTPAAGSTATFKITANTIPTYGVLSNATSSGNSVSITGTRAALITAIAAGNIKFMPAVDYTSNVANAIQFSITNANLVTVVSTANANIQVANTHAEYSFAAGTYYKNTLTPFGNTITDTDTRATSYTVTLQQTAGTAGVFYRSNVAVAGNANTLLSISNSKANINSTVSWLPATDSVGNVTFTLNQTKVTSTGNTVQAANITAVKSGLQAGPDLNLNLAFAAIASNAQVKIGAGALQIGNTAATGDARYGYLTVSPAIAGVNANAFVFGSSDDFTLEAWVYPTVTGGGGYLFGLTGNTPSGGNLIEVGNSFVVYASGDARASFSGNGLSGSSQGTANVVGNAWNHIAVTKSNSTGFITMWVDGLQGISGRSGGGSLPVGMAGNIQIGRTRTTDTASQFNGYIDEVRISNIARYSANFTPSTSAFTSDNNTLLLVHADEIGNGGVSLSNDRYLG